MTSLPPPPPPTRKLSTKRSIADNRTARLVERLHHIVVFELVKSNSSSDSTNHTSPVMRNMRLRDLYNYIQNAVCDGDDKIEGGAGGGGVGGSATTAGIDGIGALASYDNDNDNDNGSDDIELRKRRSKRRASSFAGTPVKLSNMASLPSTSEMEPAPVIPLGGYLHPRDMRKMVTPFSASNPPSLTVRRHVILVNCDPCRAIILRDRLLFLVPDGADGILQSLERRVRGGVTEAENELFGESGASDASKAPDGGDDGDDESAEDMSFELVCLDAVIQSVTQELCGDFENLNQRVNDVMEELRGVKRKGGRGASMRITNSNSNSQERLRIVKNEISALDARVNGFVRALNEVLDDDEDLALSNLSMLISHPSRFVQPVDRRILEEIGDQPELILEAYSQQALTTANSITILRTNVSSTEELVRMKLDTQRNRLLAYNTILAILSVSITGASLVGSFFGMNLYNKLEESEVAFRNVLIITTVAAGAVSALFFWGFGVVAILQ